MRFVLSPFAFIRTACLSALFPVLLLAQDFSEKSITNPMNKLLQLVSSTGVWILAIAGVSFAIKGGISEDRARWFWGAAICFVIATIIGNIDTIMSLLTWFE